MADGTRIDRSVNAANTSVTRIDARTVGTPIALVTAGPSSGIAQLARPQCSGNRVMGGSLEQVTALHNPGALAKSGARMTERLRSAILARLSNPFVGRTQPTLLHSVDANFSPMAQPAFSHAIVFPAPRASARAAKTETHCMRQAPNDRPCSRLCSSFLSFIDEATLLSRRLRERYGSGALRHLNGFG